MGVAHSAIAFFIPVYAYMNHLGQPSDFVALSLTTFTAIIFIVNVRIATVTRVFNYLTFLAYLICGCGYFPWMWASNYLTGTYTENAIPVMHQSPLFYAVIVISVVACGAFDLYFEANRVLRLQPPADFLRGLVRSGGSLDDPLEAHAFQQSCDRTAEMGKQKRLHLERSLDIVP